MNTKWLPCLRVTGVVTWALVTATPTTALDCASTLVLSCSGPPAQTSLYHWEVAHEGNFCNSGDYLGAHVQAYQFNFDQPREVTLRLSGPAAMHCDLFLLAECDEASCLASVVGLEEEKIITLCLEPGECFVALATFIEAMLPYELSLICEPCDPIGLNQISWSWLKSLYR